MRDMTKDSPRVATLWPMPGGAANYLSSMRTMLSMVDETTDTSRVLDRMMDKFGLQSRKAALSYLRVLNTLGFIELLGPRVALTEQGRAELAEPSKARVREALMTRVIGCSEILDAIHNRPMRISGLTTTLGVELGWKGESQMRYRLRWLEAVGAVARLGNARPLYEPSAEERASR